MENINLTKPKYTVGVLIYHRTQELVDMARDCVASVKKSSTDYELIIVDNGSTIKSDWECDTLIRFDKNYGISHGWNAILKNARTEYVAIIGDDVIVREGWLEALKAALEMPLAGVANPHVQHLPPGAGIVENYKWFSGACFMLPQSTVSRVGYFDENTYFPANFEDHDYWTRVYKKGLKCYVNYGMSVQHREGATVHAKDISEEFLTNKKRFMDKHGFDNQEVFCGADSLAKYL